MTLEEALRLARRIIQDAQIKGQGKIELDQVLQDLRCTFTRDGDSITIVVLHDGGMICCYQHSPCRWRRPAEQQVFLAFSRQIRFLQGSLERRLNASKIAVDLS